ncbi:hypothetical protein J6590_100646 [Homalodisca vitripennis]|nr:hypothetical protein J6590_100646 [Homalodisca vitripennis]
MAALSGRPIRLVISSSSKVSRIASCGWLESDVDLNAERCHWRIWGFPWNCSGGSTSECLIRPGPFTLSAVVSTQPIMYITALSRDFTDLETSSPPGMTFAVIVLCT